MKNQAILLGFVLLLALLAGCTALPKTQYKPGKKVQVKTGPEDLVIQEVPGGKRLLISCRVDYEGNTPGEIVSLYLPEGKPTVLPRSGEPEDLNFNPHGISWVKVGGNDFLYVVNHDKLNQRHAVLRYRVAPEKLTFDRRWESPLMIAPNAVTALEDGSFFVCNDRGKEDEGRMSALFSKKCKVLYFPAGGEEDAPKIVADDLGMATGILFHKDTLWVSATTENKVYRYLWDGKQLSQKTAVAKIHGPDNLRYLENGAVLVGAHYKFLAFIKHAKNPQKKHSPSVLALIEPDQKKPEVIFFDAGKNVSAVSGAVWADGKLYLAEIFRDYIYVVDWSKGE